MQYEVDLDIEEHANDGAPNDVVAPYGKGFCSANGLASTHVF